MATKKEVLELIHVGDVFNDRTITEGPLDKWGGVVYKCKCNLCGRETFVEGRSIIEGQKCRCSKRKSKEHKEKRRRTYCKEWANANRERLKDYDGYKNGQMNIINYTYRSLYGIPVGYYYDMLEKQDYKCLICGRRHSEGDRRTKLVIDHNHATGEIRGLLCHQCNVSLGLCGENTDVLRNMIKYLEEHNEKSS
jgi:hypothetical protein